MNEDIAETLFNLKVAVLAIVKPDQTIDDVENVVNAVASLQHLALSEVERKSVIAEIESSRIWRMGIGVELVAQDHKPWLEARSDSIDWKRWRFYATYLSTTKSINPSVLDSMDKRNRRLLDLAGDPRESGSWSRKGLVIGDVQSGKTANYLALFNKAADSGYRVFILLAGDKERLRAQTQERVDEGFVGKDSKSLGGSFEAYRAIQNIIGVGKNKGFVPANSLTSYFQDFRGGKAEQIQNLDDSEVPYVFVIKKNKAILNNLAKFLEACAGPTKKLSAPMLLVDDEADFASIDTSKPDADPTAINSGIRRLLSTFERSSYVGFTATPFANVLVDDQDDQDLFPRDFIYSLESPTNYFGPNQMFDTQSNDQNFIVPLTDGEDYFPFRHRRTLVLEDMPSSLNDAILAFYLSNSIRDLRPGQANAPRSMLVHVSRFKDVQRQVFELVNERCAEINSTLQLGIGVDLLHKEFARVFRENFSHIPEDLTEILQQLARSASGTEVFIVNSDKANSDWTRAFDGPRPRVIAVGGNILSRGLTLEGLSVSYFYRKSLAYDTVMQMGRWFGYRDGYRDVCKLWIDGDVSVWFLEIAEALEELRSQLERMHSTRETPETYGLAVRCHPGALLTVTALNKMRSGQKRPIRVSLWGLNPETIRFMNDAESFESNLASAERLVLDLKSLGLDPVSKKKKSWSKVPQEKVALFLRSYIAPKADITFGGEEFAKFVSNVTDERLSEWDVILQSGSGDEMEFADETHRPLRRAFLASSNDQNTLIVGMGHSRLGGYDDVKMALSEKALGRLPEDHKPSGAAYASELDRPLLILYPIRAEDKSNAVENRKSAMPRGFSGVVVGVSVAFPAGASSVTEPTGPEYVLNSVFQRTNSTLFDEGDYEEGDDDE
jgi:hypothetical protein